MPDIRKLSNRRILVAPSLLAADFTRLADEIAAAEKAGADVLHCDVMDGHLVPNISFGQPVIASIRKAASLPLDVHLMIEHPARYAASFAAAGADNLTFHIESADDPAETIEAIRQTGCSVGISLKPSTPPEKILPFLDRIDLILVMTVEPGFGGQGFMREQLDKLAALRRAVIVSGRNIQLEVDGGIGEATAREAAAYGGNMLVAGTAVFRNPGGVSGAVAALHAVQNVFGNAL